VLLAIDTSTTWISLALYDGVSVQYEVTWRSQHHHTVELAPAIHQLFKRTGSSGADLTGIAIAIGPGSFTSLRIGLAAAKGLSGEKTAHRRRAHPGYFSGCPTLRFR